MKLRLRNKNRTDTAYNVIDNAERIVGIVEESWNKKYWLLTMNDAPQSMRFEKLSKATKYIVSL